MIRFSIVVPVSLFLTSLLLFGPGPPSCAGGDTSRSASPERALSSHATVRPLATSKENRARSLARTTPTDEHDFCGGGAARPKRWETGLPSSSHLRILTELLAEEECADDDAGEERRRGAEAADAEEATNATITAVTTRRGRADALLPLLLLLMAAAEGSLAFLLERRMERSVKPTLRSGGSAEKRTREAKAQKGRNVSSKLKSGRQNGESERRARERELIKNSPSLLFRSTFPEPFRRREARVPICRSLTSSCSSGEEKLTS